MNSAAISFVLFCRLSTRINLLSTQVEDDDLSCSRSARIIFCFTAPSDEKFTELSFQLNSIDLDVKNRSESN